METFLEIGKVYGPCIALLAYFVWQDYVAKKEAVLREKRRVSEEGDERKRIDAIHANEQAACIKRTNELEQCLREVFTGIVQENVTLHTKVLQALERFERVQ